MQKGGASLAYVIYRQVVAVYFGLHIVLLVVGSVLIGSIEGLVDFAVWALIVLTLNIVLQAVVSLIHYKNLKHNNHGRCHMCSIYVSRHHHWYQGESGTETSTTNVLN